MARFWRHRRAIGLAAWLLSALLLAPAVAQDQQPKAGSDLYERPVLAIDPDGAVIEIAEAPSDKPGAQFAGIRIAAIDAVRTRTSRN